MRWPLPAGASGESGRLFAQGGFATPGRKARIVPTPYRGRTLAGDGAVVLNTGRVRDQWHTMTRTGAVPRLMQHIAEPVVEVAPRCQRTPC